MNNELPEEPESFYEKIFQDILTGLLVLLIVLTAVHWISDTMQERLDAIGVPPIERRR
jgi:hypothetical protein